MDDPTVRYAFLGTDPVTGGSFYAALLDFQNPSPSTHLYAGLLPDGRRLWVPARAKPSLIRRVLQTGHF